MRTTLCFLSSLFYAAIYAQSPSVPLLVDAATATQHLVSSHEPYMPPIALAAHVFGNVKLQVSIDTSGHVFAITVLQGPEMLRGSALDAVRQWTYRPFSRNDQPANATTVITVEFTKSNPSQPSGGPRVPQEFLEAEVHCREDLRANAKLEKLSKSCSQAAARADAMTDASPFGDIRANAYITTASVLLRDHQYEVVRTYTNKALALLERGYGDMAKPCAAYTTRAEAEWGIKEATTADRDFTTAEEYERLAIEVIQDDSLKKEYVRILKNVLGVHAQFLQAAGKTEAAQAKVVEAAKL